MVDTNLKGQLENVRHSFQNLKSNRKYNRYPESLKQQVLKLRSQGIPRTHLAETCSISSRTIAQWEQQSRDHISPPLKIPVIPSEVVPTSKVIPKPLNQSVGIEINIKVNIEPLLKRWGLL